MLRSKQTNAKLRRATPDDFDALYEIWMQDHINPFMSFEQMPKNEFRPIFDQLFKASDIYVIEDAGQVVAARRIIFDSDDHAHTAYFASFGVHKDHLRKGYGELFYNVFIDLIRSKRPDITRIELTQETDNDPALRLANKMGFKVEAAFPDWLPRTTGTHKDKWYIAERFHALLLDQKIETKSALDKLPPELPLLTVNSSKLKLEIKDKKANGYQDEKLQATCSFSSGVRRYAHIEFWTVQLEPGCDPKAVQAFLRELAVVAAQKHKKIEILTSDQHTLDVLSKLGFHCRGEKIASRKVGNDYFNEVGVDLGFFNIDDAKQMLTTIKDADGYQLIRVSSSLESCKKAIQQEFESKQIDQYAKLFLENMAFQMTREGMGETRLYNQSNAPWPALIDALPEKLKTVFIPLGQAAKVLGQEPKKDEKIVISNTK
ncbi:MAG: hypothetical protein A3F11_06390 [Gammaproteobacteria bacterium RIFCSPHIGHO2_12_FULL_37_14]|nr:MAG: hypothetical protein A3F11_06390 [Gammaproteobacteria bacterium RIFCSPHIGHO2_12_FULL_37_14]